jgi:hypothetical protein
LHEACGRYVHLRGYRRHTRPRDDRAIAIEAAEYLKYKNRHAEVTVHDRVTGDTVTIKTLPPGYEP